MDDQTKYAENTLNRRQKLSAKGRKPAVKTAARPSFELERAALAELGPSAKIAGVDEVGRGPLAGPVVAAAAWLSEDAAGMLAEAGLNDSKKLSETKRDALAALLLELCANNRAEAALGAASAREIDALNIRNATFLAMRRALGRLSGPIALALVDGNAAPPELGPSQTVIKGDSRSLSIAAAAVLAKTVRDRAMKRLDARWPSYGWAANAGYPTAAHRAALAERGPSPHHRRSFGRAASRAV